MKCIEKLNLIEELRIENEELKEEIKEQKRQAEEGYAQAYNIIKDLHKRIEELEAKE